jgi:ribosomal-protein-alanine N-acetyltransferase
MIREMRKEDLGRIAELENELFQDDPWPIDAFLYEMDDNPFAFLYVYEKDGRVIGYADLWITYEQAQLANIAVARKSWGKGVGSELMDFCVKQAVKSGCENLTLEVRVSNERAKKLYEKYGFITAAIRKHYYENGEDAELMIKPLGGLEDDFDFSD